MSYLSLYRKYRSQSFEDLSGQEHVTRTLQNALKAGRVAHAYLFSGPRGTGKTSTARLLARALNCEQGPTPTPCGECVACHEIRDGISPSVVEIDAASSRGIDEIRDLRQRVMTVPSQAGARKVFIVDEVHMLTTEACNALLKTLEEPPAHVLFVLATTDSQKLPATILSRCQRFEFRRGSIALISERIKYVAEAEGYSLEPEAARLIARASGGSWRDAISLLEQVLSYGGTEVTAEAVASVLGSVGQEALEELAEGLAGADGRTVYPIVERLISEGTEPRQLARDLGEHFRALLMADAGALPPDAYRPDTAQRLAEQAVRFGTARLVTALEALAQAEKEMRWSDSGRVVLEVALARLMLPASPAADGRGQAAGARHTAAANRVAEEPVRSPAAPPTYREGSGNPSSGLESTREPPVGEAGASVPARPLPQQENGGTSADAEPEFDPFEHEELPRSITGGRTVPKPTPSNPNTSKALADPPLHPALDQIRGRWRVVVEELKRVRPATTAALVAEAVPLRMEDDVLVIAFRYNTLREKWDRTDHKQRLSAALKAVLGLSLRVRSEVIPDDWPIDIAPAPPDDSKPGANHREPTTENHQTPPRPAVAAATPSAHSDTLEGEPLLHEVIALFDGQIVEQDTHED